MKPIQLKIWIIWAAILFGLGVLADYYFLHILFQEKQNQNGTASQQIFEAEVSEIETTTPPPSNTDTSFLDSDTPDELPNPEDNFLEALRQCAPEIAAQAIATPEAFLEYLKKSVGIAKEDISIENYHLTLADGSLRRVHVVAADNTNSKDKKEIRYFAVDEEGYPERLPLPEGATLKSLLKQGTLTRHETRSRLEFKDSSSMELEMHDQRAYDFQYRDDGKVLSCRVTDCRCS